MLIYGVCISDIEQFNEDKFMNFFRELYDEGYTHYLDDYLETRYMKRKYDETEYSVQDWLYDFESSGYFGLAAFLKEIITAIEGLAIACDDPDGVHYLGILPDVPWKFAARTKDISNEEFNKILSGYINKVCDDELEIKWWHHAE